MLKFIAPTAAACLLAVPAAAVTIDYTVLSGGTQPEQVANGTTTNTGYDYFTAPSLIDGEHVAQLSVTNAAGVALDIFEATFDSFANAGPSATVLSADVDSDVEYEASVSGGGNGTAQGTARSSAWGADSSKTIDNSSNTVLSFALSNNTSGTFSAVLLDLEGGAVDAPPAYVGVYNAAGLLTDSFDLLFDAPAYGESQEILFEFTGLDATSTISFFVGDDDENGDGYRERIAAADFATFAADTPAVPLPASSLLLIGGLGALVAVRRRR